MFGGKGLREGQSSQRERKEKEKALVKSSFEMTMCKQTICMVCSIYCPERKTFLHMIEEEKKK